MAPHTGPKSALQLTSVWVPFTLGVFASAFLLTSKGLSYFKREALGGIMFLTD